MLHAHPRIDRETVRVRFAGYGDSALTIDLRVYVATHEWNDFFAAREDVFLRIYDLVTEAGTGFAFPSQTVFLGRDGGVDADRTEAAEAVGTGLAQRGATALPALRRRRHRAVGHARLSARGSVTSGRAATEMAARKTEGFEARDEPPSKNKRPANP